MDYLLPIQVHGEWVGVVYRDEDCAMALMDGYDVGNKAILCNPAFDPCKVEWLRSNSNEHNRLRIIMDEEWKELGGMKSCKVNNVCFLDLTCST